MKQFELQFIDDVDVQIEETDGINSPQNDVNTATYGSLKIGRLEVSEIYIPNKTSPLFSVDDEGNAKVNSLARNDFHWFTTFESVDGYSKITDGTGTITATLDGVEVKTGNVTDNDTEVKKALGDEISFDKNCKFKCEVKIVDDDWQRIEIGIGTIGTYPSSAKHFSFLVNGSTLYAIMADGATANETELQEISAGGTYLLEAELDASTGFVKFYVDGSLSHTSDDSITPTGAGNYSFIVRARTKENAVKEAIVKWWDFWQAI